MLCSKFHLTASGIFYVMMFYLIVTSCNNWGPISQGCLCELVGCLLTSAWVSRPWGAPRVHTKDKAPTCPLGDVCKQGNPHPQKRLFVLVTNASCERGNVCNCECVCVHVCDFNFLELVIELHLEICRCSLTFPKHLVFWFICCIADVDPKYTVH